MSTLRDIFIGPPLPTFRLSHERLSNLKALAALSPDALASVAYANQEIFLGLVIAGAVGLQYQFAIALAIGALLIFLSLSYSQTVSAYPSGGGSYTVARENLGATVGLFAASALVLDYVLNVAVSITAGVAAVASAFPPLVEWRVLLGLALLVVITFANLRGLREAGAVMTIPVYLFLGSFAVLIISGVVRILLGERPGVFDPAIVPIVEQLPPLALIGLLMHTFAAGCTALTGVEAISNGVTIFKPPESKHANQTMAVMATLMGFLFLGTIGLTQYFAITPERPDETILSALTRHVFGEQMIVPYLLVQASTLLMLMVAANTSFMDFPRVASILARDGYVPRQLSFLGDRLVFSNGIIILSALAGVLIVAFGGDTHSLIPLFAIGAFLAFTLSQAGMVVHWWKLRGPGWPIKLSLNALGTIATAIALGIIGYNKVGDGAWIVLILIPAQVLLYRSINNHYRGVREQLTLYKGLPPDLKALPPPRVVMPISGVHRGIIDAVRYARSISEDVKAVYIEIEPGGSQQVLHRWDEWGLDEDADLIVVPSPFRSVVGPFIEYLDEEDHKANDGQLATVLLPQFVTARWWEGVLHNQTAWLIKLMLLYSQRKIGKIRAIIDVPMFLRD